MLKRLLATAAAVASLAAVVPAATPAVAAPVVLDAAGQRLSFFNTVGGPIKRICANPTLSNSIGTGTAGCSHRYENVITVGSQSVDAVVTLVKVENIDFDADPTNGIDNSIRFMDSYVSSSDDTQNFGIYLRQNINGKGWSCVGDVPLYTCDRGEDSTGYSRFRVDFFLPGTTTPVTLLNFALWIDDIDLRQYAEVTGAAAVTVSADTALKAVNLGGGRFRAFEPTGMRFGGCDPDNYFIWGCTDVDLHRAQAEFNFLSASSASIELGSNQGGDARFDAIFEPNGWGSVPTKQVDTSTRGGYLNYTGSMEGSIKFSAGSWVSGGWHLKLGKANPQPVTVDVTGTISVPVRCGGPQGPLAVGSPIVIPVDLLGVTIPAGSTAWVPTADQKSILSWMGALQAPDLCGGEPMYNAEGARFSGTFETSGYVGTMSVQWHYRVPAAKGAPNTNCSDPSDPNRNRSSVCGASWSATKSF